MRLKTKVYYFFTRVRDWGIPGLTWIADEVRDYCYNEELYDN